MSSELPSWQAYKDRHGFYPSVDPDAARDPAYILARIEDALECSPTDDLAQLIAMKVRLEILRDDLRFVIGTDRD